MDRKLNVTIIVLPHSNRDSLIMLTLSVGARLQVESHRGASPLHSHTSWSCLFKLLNLLVVLQSKFVCEWVLLRLMIIEIKEVRFYSRTLG